MNRRGFFGTLVAGAVAKLLPLTDKVEAMPPMTAETVRLPICRVVGNTFDPGAAVTTTTGSSGTYTIWTEPGFNRWTP